VFADTEAQMKLHQPAALVGQNTTLGVVATNARLDKVAATKLAQLAGLGMARTIYPVNTMFDGDTVFALSIGESAGDINVLGSAAAEAMAQAILRAVKQAKTLGGVLGLG
jgi:L-aminopeptidase/D-esterase-like protein